MILSLPLLAAADVDEADGGRIVLNRVSIGLNDEAEDDDDACVAEAVVVLPAASAATTIAAATAADVNDLNPDRTMVLICYSFIVVSSLVVCITTATLLLF